MSSTSKQSHEESMKKRFCPFSENLSPQLKVHIGLTESADRDEKEKELQKIYDRTMQMLKNGPKITNANTNLSTENEKNAGYHFELPKFKQMILTNNLELEVSKKLFMPVVKKSCSNCKRNNVVDSSCFLCIEFHCSDCLSKCSKCSELFCSKCSLTIYDGGEHVECLACY